MDRKLFKLVSIFALLSIGVPSVEGEKGRNSKMALIAELREIFKTPAFRSCKRYFKKMDARSKKEVHLDTLWLRTQKQFNDCFIDLSVIIDALSGEAKQYCFKLIDDLMSYGRKKGFTNGWHIRTLNQLKIENGVDIGQDFVSTTEDTSEIYSLINEIDDFLNTHLKNNA